jgi:hypothetical protein
VADYIAKYATKGAETAGAVDGRIHHARDSQETEMNERIMRGLGE